MSTASPGASPISSRRRKELDDRVAQLGRGRGRVGPLLAGPRPAGDRDPRRGLPEGVCRWRPRSVRVGVGVAVARGSNHDKTRRAPPGVRREAAGTDAGGAPRLGLVEAEAEAAAWLAAGARSKGLLRARKDRVAKARRHGHQDIVQVKEDDGRAGEGVLVLKRRASGDDDCEQEQRRSQR